jgi:hypothetical protein
MTAPTEPAWLAELAALEAAATAEPWECGGYHHGWSIYGAGGDGRAVASDVNGDDARLIAAARSALPRLLAVARLAGDLALVHVEDGDELGVLAREILAALADATEAGR